MTGVAHQDVTSRTGVVFSSGYFGFFAHAGFFAALRQLRIVPCGYAGASSGAIIAGMAASGMSDHAIREVLLNLRKSDFWDPDPMRIILKGLLHLFRGYSGYLRGEGFARLLERIPVKRIEECPTPLVIAATNLTLRREELFTRGSLIRGIQASGALPMLFKPVEINGSLYVDGGMVTKGPVRALVDLVRPRKIIVHFIASDNLEGPAGGFLRKRMTAWHVHRLAVNISRQAAYERERAAVTGKGIEVIEVKTNAPRVGPNSLERGPSAYAKAREATLEILSKEGF